MPKNKNAVVLDAGCGNARNAVVIAEQPKVKRVFAVDVSARMLVFARKRVKTAGLTKKITLVKADFARRLPLRNASIDAAFYLASLHHLKKSQQQTAFKEMARVMKPGGLAFVSVWNKAQRKFWENRSKHFFVSWTKRGGGRVKRFHYFFEEKELEALGESAGFEIVDSFFERGGARAQEKEAKNLCVVFRKTGVSTKE
jgi:ubiquinone/menaquinone biosynthesis C-methylase UbiE